MIKSCEFAFWNKLRVHAVSFHSLEKVCSSEVSPCQTHRLQNSLLCMLQPWSTNYTGVQSSWGAEGPSTRCCQGPDRLCQMQNPTLGTKNKNSGQHEGQRQSLSELISFVLRCWVNYITLSTRVINTNMEPTGLRPQKRWWKRWTSQRICSYWQQQFCEGELVLVQFCELLIYGSSSTMLQVLWAFKETTLLTILLAE